MRLVYSARRLPWPRGCTASTDTSTRSAARPPTPAGSARSSGRSNTCSSASRPAASRSTGATCPARSGSAASPADHSTHGSRRPRCSSRCPLRAPTRTSPPASSTGSTTATGTSTRQRRGPSSLACTPTERATRCPTDSTRCSSRRRRRSRPSCSRTCASFLRACPPSRLHSICICVHSTPVCTVPRYIQGVHPEFCTERGCAPGPPARLQRVDKCYHQQRRRI
mmetsp:Transcript_15057/g.43176  ORF Transcript_15057/g.43176 Transcript_15057/m.43176 type:complete len:224 (-) Transcript_15057:17-688(-)